MLTRGGKKLNAGRGRPIYYRGGCWKIKGGVLFEDVVPGCEGKTHLCHISDPCLCQTKRCCAERYLSKMVSEKGKKELIYILKCSRDSILFHLLVQGKNHEVVEKLFEEQIRDLENSGPWSITKKFSAHIKKNKLPYAMTKQEFCRYTKLQKSDLKH